MDKPKQQKKPLVVVKKKKIKVASPTKKIGLPTFGAKACSQVDSGARRTTLDQGVQRKSKLDGFLEEIDDDNNEFPSEAMMAIDVLTTSRLDSAMSIPIQGSRSIFGVAECQIQEFFRSKQTGSSQLLSRDLDTLVRSSKIIMLATPNDFSGATSIAVYVKRSDYLLAAREALTTSPEVSDWFCGTVVTIAGSKISRKQLVVGWGEHCKSLRKPSSLPAENVLKTLQDRQVLLAVSSQNIFQLTLPNWGSLVLPAFQKASKDTLVFIKQSRYGERSIVSLKKRLSRNPIPVSGLLVPWMVSEGLIRVDEKPSGGFVSLPKA